MPPLYNEVFSKSSAVTAVKSFQQHWWGDEPLSHLDFKLSNLALTSDCPSIGFRKFEDALPEYLTFLSHPAVYMSLLPSTGVRYSRSSWLTAEEMLQDWTR